MRSVKSRTPPLFPDWHTRLVGEWIVACAPCFVEGVSPFLHVLLITDCGVKGPIGSLESVSPSLKGYRRSDQTLPFMLFRLDPFMGLVHSDSVHNGLYK